MAEIPYDAAFIAGFYDEYGEREWERFDARPMDRVGLEVHRRFLREFVHAGDRVLDAGAGPGRFTLELAELGTWIVAGDISTGQLELHRQKTASVEASIEDRVLLDIVDLSQFGDGEFDVVVCFGGPLSYVLGEADRAVAELLRVTRPGGRVLLSVMSLLGSTRAFFSFFPDLVEEFGWQRAVADVIETGDLPADVNRGHVCRCTAGATCARCSGATRAASSGRPQRTSSRPGTTTGTSVSWRSRSQPVGSPAPSTAGCTSSSRSNASRPARDRRPDEPRPSGPRSARCVPGAPPRVPARERPSPRAARAARP